MAGIENLGENIRAARQAQGLSQEAVARRADLSLNVVARIELGIITNPHFMTLDSIARALGVTVEELVEEPTHAGKASAPPETGLSEATPEAKPAEAPETEPAPLSEEVLYREAYAAHDFDAVWEKALDTARQARSDYLERGMKVAVYDDGESVEVRAEPLARQASPGRTSTRQKKTRS